VDRESNGSARADWGDTGSIAATGITTHVVVLILQAAALSLVVQGIARSDRTAGDIVIDDPRHTT